MTLDTTTELVDIDVKKTFETPASGSETTEITASKNTSAVTIGGTLTGIFGIPSATVTLMGTRTSETSSSAEVKKFNSKITLYESRDLV